jgi:ribosome-binding protein aMBF1 (putative translation factor)
MGVKQDVQFILTNGQPEWAILPYQLYVKLKDQEQLVTKLISEKPGSIRSVLPAHMHTRLRQGESPIRVWREFKDLSQAELAMQASISIPYLSQLEHQIRSGSKKVLKRIAAALSIELDALV